MSSDNMNSLSRLDVAVLSGTGLAISETAQPRWLASAACISQVDYTLGKEVSTQLLVAAL